MKNPLKKTKLLVLASASFMMLGALSPSVFKRAETFKDYVGEDNAEYGEELVKDFNNPDFDYKVNAVTSATSISIHYHNEDGKCAERAVWIWCPNVNGSQFLPTSVTNGGKDMEVKFNFTGEHAAFANKKSISFIIKMADSWLGQSENVELLYEDYPPNADGLTEVWVIPGEGDAVEVYTSEADTKMDRFQYASFNGWKQIKVIATDVPSTWRLYALTSRYLGLGLAATQADLDKCLIKEGSNPSCTSVTYNSLPCKQFTINLNYTAKVNVQYYLEGVFPNYQSYTKTKYVTSDTLYETARFEQYYQYDKNDLGCTYNDANSTTFRVWAPTAGKVRVLLYNSGSAADYKEEDPTATDNVAGGYDMAFRPGGVWEVTIANKDLNGMYYNYYVYNSLGKNVATDPYAKAVGVNGSRGMVVNFAETNPTGWSDVPDIWNGRTGYDIANPNDLSIYETHIRDLTMHSSWNGSEMRGTYSAFVEKGTTYTNGTTTVKTGFDHIEEMGVKAVQLEPVFDSDNLEGVNERSYNWGYNPLNYNCVDGSYATNPYDGAARIKEYKELVQAFANNKNHTRVIMDVVYNHVASAPSSCFHKLMPKYYFRYTEAGNYWNGSGCGNDVKTEAPMMSKYIVDSLCWWAKEYKIKGFRFDLMGLIDWKTIQKAAQELYKIDPDIYIYGEGWTGDGSDAHIDNADSSSHYYGNWGANTWTVYNKLFKSGNMCYVGAFNDAGRNALKGENNIDNAFGFISQDNGHVGGNSSKVADMLVGYHSGVGGNPNQCINYASCHDNYTLFDQLTYTVSNNGTNDFPGIVCAASTAVNCAIMFSNGVAFMQGGEELFRTKVVSSGDLEQYGNSDTTVIAGKTISHNSYRLSDYTNAYDWSRKISVGSVYVLDYVQELEKAIALRSSLTKYDYDQLNAAGHNPFDSGSPMNVWNQGDGSCTVAMKNGDYFFFINGQSSDDIPFGAYNGSPAYNKQVFCSNPKSGGFSNPSTGYIRLGWSTCVCLTK